MLNIKSSFYFLFIILFVLSCTNSKPKETTTAKEKEEEKWSIAVFPDNLNRFPEVRTTHLIQLAENVDNVPVRKRAITETELFLSNSSSDIAKSFNDSTIIAYLFKNQEVELIEETDRFYKVEFEFKSQPIEGFIIKKHAGKSTLTKDENRSYQIQNSAIKNPEILPYCRVFITEKLNKLLIKGGKEKNKIKYLNKTLEQLNTELIIYSVFVGERNREIYRPRPKDIWSSDDVALVHAIKNTYYAYEFFNYFYMYMHMAPYVPVKIDSFSFSDDTLKIRAINYNEYSNLDYNDSKQIFQLYPLDSKKAFTSRHLNKWILNDTTSLIDISYVADKLVIPETQIGHMYFYTILDNYIQELWPKRKEGYLIHRN